MKLWELFKEWWRGYRKEFIASRKAKPWKANLFFIPIIFAIAVVFVILVKMFIPPEWL